MMNRFAIITLYILVLVPAAFAQYQQNPQEKLSLLNERIQQAINRKQHNHVESYLDEVVAMMEELHTPIDTIREQTHQKIQYSYSNGRLEQARQAAVKWLEREPNDLKTLDLLGTIVFQMNRLLEARDAMAKVYQANPTGPATQRRYLKVLTLLDERDDALTVCNQILQSNGSDSRSLVEVLESSLHFSEVAQAQESLQTLQELGYDPDYLNYIQGQIWQEESKWQQAIEQFSLIPENNPHFADSLFRMGLCFAGLREWEQAARKNIEFLTIVPEDKPAFAQLQQSLARLRKPKGSRLVNDIRQSAEQRFLAADEAQYMERQGNIAEAASLHSIVAIKQGLYNQAEQILKRAVEREPDSLECKMNLADFYIHTQQANRAESLFKSVLVTAPQADKAAIQSRIYQTQLLQGNTQNIESALNEDGLSQSKKLEYQALLGSYYLEIAGAPNTAVKLLDEARTIVQNSRGYFIRAKVELGKMDGLEQELATIPADEQDVSLKMAMVQIYVHLNRVEQARELFDQTLKVHPKLSAIITAKAHAVLATAENHPDTDEIVSKAHQVTKVLPQIRQLTVAVNKNGWSESLQQLLELSEIHENLGNHNEAIQYLYMAHNAQPESESVHKILIQRLNQPMDAIERLYQIRMYNQKHNTELFKQESNEVLAFFELN